MVLDPVQVADPSDVRLAAYRRLNNPARRDRVEAGEGIFVVEGHLALEQMVASAYPLESVLVTPNRLQPLADLLAAAGESAPVYVADRDVVAATVGFDLHRGVVAVGRRLAPADPMAVVASARVVMVLEGVNDHENLGALFRNARALGAGAVLLDPTCADPLYRRSVRVSLGHVLRVPFARLQPWTPGLASLRRAGFTVVALTPDPTAAPIGSLEPPRRVALVVGAEGPGLSAAARAAADVEARIPMVSGVDSLNVATAAAIALHRLAGATPT